MKLTRIVPFILLLTDACIERYDIPEHVTVSALVVDGLMTDQTGPHTIKLYESLNVNEDLDRHKPVMNAEVNILDDIGNVTILSEAQPGIYVTPGSMRGVVGRKYQASIRVNGKEYRSTEQELLPAGTIQSVRYSIEHAVINADDLNPVDALDFFIDAQGEAGYPNLFRWRWSSTYEVQAYPELRTTFLPGSGPPIEVPDPAPCSGIIVDLGALVRVDTCSCCRCWYKEVGEHALISNNRLVDNATFTNTHIARVPVARRRFNVRYYIKVEQLSLSEEVYEFWKLVRSQQDGEGNIFQPNAIRIKGNIQAVSNPDEKVFGIFAVSGVASKDVFIDRKDLPIRIPLDSIKNSCQQIYPDGTNISPPFW